MTTPTSGEQPIYYNYQVITSYPHDNTAFTQGLVFDQGCLYEGTGLYGASTLRKVRLEDGKVLEQVNLAANLFGEGIAIANQRIYQLTWQENQGIVYDLAGLNIIDQFNYVGEGWGLTFDGEHLIMSDGTSQLTFLDPDTYNIVRQISVAYNDEPVIYINELEYIAGLIYANVWLTDQIIMIEPQSGAVVGVIDLSGLSAEQNLTDDDAVLNGIAYDPIGQRIFVTGKLWSRVYHIELTRVF